MTNEIELDIDLPWKTKKEVDRMLQVIDEDQLIKGYTLDESMNIVQVWCSIENNGSYNYHNNYDDSEPAMYLYMCDVDLEPKDRERYRKNQWWTLSLEKIRFVQNENIEKHLKKLRKEVEKLENLDNSPKTLKETLILK